MTHCPRRAAANCYCQLLASQSDNNVKLIVLDRLQVRTLLIVRLLSHPTRLRHLLRCKHWKHGANTTAKYAHAQPIAVRM